ncbi:hypothetical protein ACQPW3_34210 [Actinosynnema sp. CA-248983]
MSGAVAFVFGLCALSFAAGCVLTAYMLRREPEPERPPAPAPELPPVELKLDVVWPPEDYATKPIHRNPVMGLPVTERPAEPARPALTLVPELEPVVDEPEPEAAEPDIAPGLDIAPEPEAEAEAAEPEAAEPEAAEPEAAEPEAAEPEAAEPEAAEPEAAEPVVGESEVAPEPVVVEVPAQPEPVVVECPEPEPVAEVPVRAEPQVPAQPLHLPDPSEFRQRYLRSFEAARKRTST